MYDVKHIIKNIHFTYDDIFKILFCIISHSVAKHQLKCIIYLSRHCAQGTVLNFICKKPPYLFRQPVSLQQTPEGARKRLCGIFVIINGCKNIFCHKIFINGSVNKIKLPGIHTVTMADPFKIISD